MSSSLSRENPFCISGVRLLLYTEERSFLSFPRRSAHSESIICGIDSPSCSQLWGWVEKFFLWGKLSSQSCLQCWIPWLEVFNPTNTNTDILSRAEGKDSFLIVGNRVLPGEKGQQVFTQLSPLPCTAWGIVCSPCKCCSYSTWSFPWFST